MTYVSLLSGSSGEPATQEAEMVEGRNQEPAAGRRRAPPRGLSPAVPADWRFDRPSGVETHAIEVVIGHSEGRIAQIDSLFKRLCSKPLEHALPESVTRFAAWISENDATISRKLMAAIETEESLLIVNAARAEISRLVEAIRHMDQRVTGTHTVCLPYGKITILVRTPSVLEKMKRFFK